MLFFYFSLCEHTVRLFITGVAVDYCTKGPQINQSLTTCLIFICKLKHSPLLIFLINSFMAEHISFKGFISCQIYDNDKQLLKIPNIQKFWHFRSMVKKMKAYFKTGTNSLSSTNILVCEQVGICQLVTSV